MITLITGAPGSGKSAALVALLADITRKDITRGLYVNGIPELKIRHVALEDAEVATWHTELPDGAVVVLDEVQRLWRPRGAAAKVPEHIAALETHRHRGFDFFLITQHPNLLDSNVRRLVGRHVHIRDCGWPLGRHWYEWPEAANPDQWRGAPIKKAYKLPKAAFALYKSSSLHVKPIRSIPRSALVLALCVPALAFASWRAYDGIGQRIGTADAVNSGSGQTAQTQAPPAAVTAASSPRAAVAVLEPVAEVVAPKQLLGCIAFKDRCECIGDDGRIATEVEPAACVRNSQRSGAGIVYAVKPASGSVPVVARATEPKTAVPEAFASGGSISLGGDPRAHLRSR